MIVIKLLTSPNCPMCPKAKDVVKKLTEDDKDVVALELPVNTDEGFQEAVKFGISVVPAMIINDEYVILGVPSLEDLRDIVKKFKQK